MQHGVKALGTIPSSNNNNNNKNNNNNIVSPNLDLSASPLLLVQTFCQVSHGHGVYRSALGHQSYITQWLAPLEGQSWPLLCVRVPRGPMVHRFPGPTPHLLTGDFEVSRSRICISISADFDALDKPIC